MKTLRQISEMSGGNIAPTFYYIQGNEDPGYVSTGLYLDNIWYDTGQVKKDEAIKAGLKYHCPFCNFN